MQQPGSFACRPLSTPLPRPVGGVKIQLFHHMVMLLINHECGNMVANTLLADHLHPLDSGLGQKVQIQLLHNIVMLHIK